jgi:hypothetical protein
MSKEKIRELISILRESPLYATLSADEEHSLITALAERYPFLVHGKSKGIEAH